jgi:hypothetical protein
MLPLCHSYFCQSLPSTGITLFQQYYELIRFPECYLHYLTVYRLDIGAVIAAFRYAENVGFQDQQNFAAYTSHPLYCGLVSLPQAARSPCPHSRPRVTSAVTRRESSEQMWAFEHIELFYFFLFDVSKAL